MVSTVLSGQLATGFGYNAAFLWMSGIAALSAALFRVFMPETRPETPAARMAPQSALVQAGE